MKIQFNSSPWKQKIHKPCTIIISPKKIFESPNKNKIFFKDKTLEIAYDRANKI